jgi:hypothetical protein
MTLISNNQFHQLISQRPSFEPRVYFGSDRDEGFREAEFGYAHAHFTWNRHAKLDEQREALNDLEKPLHELLDAVDKGQRPSSKLVIDCFKSLIDYRTMPAPQVETAAQNEVFKQIQRWYADAKYYQNEVARKSARKNLDLLSRVLIPDGRGKKEPSKDDWDILGFYYQTLFRLFHIRHALKLNPGTWRAKMEKAATDFALYPADYFEEYRELTLDSVREMCGLTEDYEVIAPVNLKQLARIITGARFELSNKTVANLLSD